MWGVLCFDLKIQEFGCGNLTQTPAKFRGGFSLWRKGKLMSVFYHFLQLLRAFKSTKTIENFTEVEDNSNVSIDNFKSTYFGNRYR